MFGLKKNRRGEFETFVAPCLDGLYVAALRLTRNPAEAEDLVQDAVMRGYKFFDSFERGTNFRAWIFKILSNTFINGYRKQRKAKSLSDVGTRNSVEAGLFSAGAQASAQHPETKLVEQLYSQRVIEAIEALSEDFRMVVVLADIEEFSYKEIAEMLDIPVGTVMSRLFRGRKQLQNTLRKDELPDETAPVALDEYRERKKVW
jgi:RNA polymerase sigma-70 factor, ECF subfamily